jgi:4-alpha-glucanotransferase
VHTSDTIARDPARSAGILLHPTSLPGRYGIGDLGDELIAFLDWAAAGGMTVWQVLPLNPPGYGHSPYGCTSSFAGNPLLISPQRLMERGFLTSGDLESGLPFPEGTVDFDAVAPWKDALLRKAWQRFESSAGSVAQESFHAFVVAPEQREWLDDFALYAALKEVSDGAPWWDWSAGLAGRQPEALTEARARHVEDIRFHEFVQWIFFSQWAAVREAAHMRGLRIVGDVPIYVAHDSADTWSHRELFQLDERGRATAVAGVPPDYFSVTGQRWGNPLYRWGVMQEDGFAWWVSRIRANLRLADLVRLDHFRGFAAYWEVPASEPTAEHGQWKPGPGQALFDAIRAALGTLPLIAEDLGFITEDVHALRKAIDVPGMKIVQFGFSQIDSPHLPHRFEPATVAYTGTHDNDTARGWFAQAPLVEQLHALDYLGVSAEEIAWGLVRAVYLSVAQTAIVPVQDILGIGSEGRMNRPGDAQHNWSWRLASAALTDAHALRLHRLAEISGRI